MFPRIDPVSISHPGVPCLYILVPLYGCTLYNQSIIPGNLLCLHSIMSPGSHWHFSATLACPLWALLLLSCARVFCCALLPRVIHHCAMAGSSLLPSPAPQGPVINPTAPLADTAMVAAKREATKAGQERDAAATRVRAAREHALADHWTGFAWTA